MILSFILALGISHAAIGQTGRVYDKLSMASKILKMDRNYAVYLPPDYDISDRSYPVLYLLHGASDNQTGWVQFGEVHSIADAAIKSGIATSMIIIMPDADTGKMGYFNEGKDWRYEDFFFEEFMPFVEEKYRIRKDKKYRAIAGLSMGGGGSFMYALHHPELFSSACPLSAYVGPLKIEDFDNRLLQTDVKYSQKEKEEYFKKHNVIELLETVSLEQIKSVRWYIDCGDDDFLYEGNSLIHIAMRKKKIPHEYRVKDGKHNWPYWRQALPDVLEFVSQAFHQN